MPICDAQTCMAKNSAHLDLETFKLKNNVQEIVED
jgi:hypothetical protein